MSRKYRQQGYKDDDREPRRQGPSGPRERREGPRGRGLGKPTKTSFKCARCGTEIHDPEVALDATCGECGSDLHSCTNCRHFDSSAPMECRKSIPERIAKKAHRNECELFEPKAVQGFASDAGGSPDDARSEFDNLFDF